MITSFRAGPAGELHAVHVIHQKGITAIRAVSLCNIDTDAGAGVFQVADWAFDGRPKYGEIPVCQKCAGTVTSMQKVPPK
jgi:hypothetical protein